MADERDPGANEAKPAAEEAPHSVARGDRVHAFEAPGITVTWSRRRCTHAAECVMNLPEVFEPGRRPWVEPALAAPDSVAHAVMRCPTGALHFERHDGGPAESLPTTNTVVVSRHGPLLLHGDLEVLGDDGRVMLRDTRAALCRCGLSKLRPLCDDSHHAARFRDSGEVKDADSVQESEAAGTKLRVIPERNGPLELSGPFTLVSADGKVKLAGSSTWLCRCGQSQTKPFCDGSHKRVGFESDKP